MKFLHINKCFDYRNNLYPLKSFMPQSIVSAAIHGLPVFLIFFNNVLQKFKSASLFKVNPMLKSTF